MNKLKEYLIHFYKKMFASRKKNHSLDDAFIQSHKLYESIPISRKNKIDINTKISLYALYNQAIYGNNNIINSPNDIIEIQYWNAWNELHNKTSDHAKQSYIILVYFILKYV